jgi:hypothetical protein
MAGVLLALALSACSATSAQRAGEGALSGGAAGAVGGMISAAIFGGDVGDAAARGAAWGASVGAVGGAMRGSAEDRARQEREAAAERRKIESEISRIRAEIGEDAFDGLAALTDGKHEVALAYARTASRSDNRAHSLAGIWLEALTNADAGQRSQASAILASLVDLDPEVSSAQEAQITLHDLQEGLAEIRSAFGITS